MARVHNLQADGTWTLEQARQYQANRERVYPELRERRLRYANPAPGGAPAPAAPAGPSYGPPPQQPPASYQGGHGGPPHQGFGRGQGRGYPDRQRDRQYSDRQRGGPMASTLDYPDALSQPDPWVPSYAPSAATSVPSMDCPC